MLKLRLLPFLFLPFLAGSVHGAERIPVRVQKHSAGAPITLGVPFPLGALTSPDRVRVVSLDGREILSQVTEVSTWEPASESIKWVWVFFFAESEEEYFIEYGADVHRALAPTPRIEILNTQRDNGFTEVTTGPLRFKIKKGKGGGFLDEVFLDTERDGFQDADRIASAETARGSFLDLLDDKGLDPSNAIVHRMVVEKGSGPLSSIVRIEGEYTYGREDHPSAPFVTRIHAYAGQSYLRVLHTFVYTGEPDRHRKGKGEHAHVATQGEFIIEEDPDDPGWTLPKDRISATGLGISFVLSTPLRYRTSLFDGKWWDSEAAPKHLEGELGDTARWSLLQSGPSPTRMPPLPVSADQKRLEGFRSSWSREGEAASSAERAAGWVDVSGGRRGVAAGIRSFLEEYPKEIQIDTKAKSLTSFLWSKATEPMSFARWRSKAASTGAVENWAQGLAKTSELVFYFHPEEAFSKTESVVRYFLEPPVAHAEPRWYAASEVWGKFATRSEQWPDFERALDYKYEWVLFNQRWEPWFGMFDYGDTKYRYDGNQWITWLCNEPALDFMLFLQFMRTADPRLFFAAEAAARHSMDVDNIHWPSEPRYVGDTNDSLDYFTHREGKPEPSPYVGIGKRHDTQHWTQALSAHVWVQGWLASYYLAGYHRGLDVAIQTAEMYMKRIWGEHGLTGRRLYLSVWNLIEVWDATKDPRYLGEIEERIQRMIRIQDREQGGRLVMDRYGYAEIYVSQSLPKYFHLTGDRRVRAALIRNARRIRDVPPRDHALESYLGSINGLLVGYELSGESSFREEALRRASMMKTAALPEPPAGGWTRGTLYRALNDLDPLPKTTPLPSPLGRERMPVNWSLTHGLRIFGWTHAFALPRLLYWLAK